MNEVFCTRLQPGIVREPKGVVLSAIANATGAKAMYRSNVLRQFERATSALTSGNEHEGSDAFARAIQAEGEL